MEKKKEHPAVQKALSIMAENKKKKLAEGQAPVGDAGIPANMVENVKAGVDEYGTDSASSGRAMLEQQNNKRASDFAKKLAEAMMKKKAKGK
jgi:hypothetical protein